MLAAFLSPILPGVGHLMIKRRRMAIFLLLLFCLLLFICWPFRLLSHVAFFFLFALGMLLLCIFAGWNAGYAGKRHPEKPSQWWLMVLLPFSLFVVAAHLNWVSRAAGFQVFVVPSRSMEDTVSMGSRVMVDRWYYSHAKPAEGEVVIYRNIQGLYLIKRVIAGAGTTIEGRQGAILVNNQRISESYVKHSGGASFDMNNFGPEMIPEGKLFVMGDNRDISLDSRSQEIGPIDASWLIGKPLYAIPRLGTADELKIIR